MNKVGNGSVKWFNESKGFGFIKADGRDVFFHFNNLVSFEEGEKEPQFSGSPTIETPRGTSSLRIPKMGDEVVFIQEEAEKGPRAYSWGYKRMYTDMQKRIANRKDYRVLSQRNTLGNPPSGPPEVLWEGWDLEALRKEFPKPGDGKSISGDPLIPYWGDPDNIFEVRHWFEVQTDNVWEKCKDLR